jgi:hypothetical protein
VLINSTKLQSRKKLRRAVRSALGAAIAIAAVGLLAQPASAATVHPDSEHTMADHYSSDAAHGGDFTAGFIDWYEGSQAGYWHMEGNIFDNASDGHGPILFVKAYDRSGNRAYYNYYHNTKGYYQNYDTYDDYSTGSPRIHKLILQVCNGGSESAPLNCSAAFSETNPWY